MSFGKAAIDGLGEELNIGPQERIAYKGELPIFLEQTLASYELGTYVNHEVKENGYEDFNVVVETSSGKVFVKCFADWRSPKDCERYVEMMLAAGEVGVTTPELYRNKTGNELSEVKIDNETVYLVAMRFLDGGNVWESNQPLTPQEKESVIQEAAKISKISFRPQYVKDSWAIVNIAETYARNRDRIEEADRIKVEGLITKFQNLDFSKLPTCFVHGDMRTTNLMRHSDGRLYVIDFSVANIYPRVMELAVLFSDVLFDPTADKPFEKTYNLALKAYGQAGVNLESYELEALPLFIKMAYAANIIGANSVDATQYISQAENEHWLQLGKQALHRVI